MAQMYQRYIPPKKSKAPVEEASPARAPVNDSPASNGLYARYVPPRKPTVQQQASSPLPQAPASIRSLGSDFTETKKRKREYGSGADSSTPKKSPTKSKESKHKRRAIGTVPNTNKTAQPVAHFANKLSEQVAVGGQVNEEILGLQDSEPEETGYDPYMLAGQEAPVEPYREVYVGEDWNNDGEEEVDVSSIFAKYSVTGGGKKAATTEEGSAVLEETDTGTTGGADAVIAKYKKSLTLSQRRSKREKLGKSGEDASPEPELHDLVPLPQPERTPTVPYKTTFKSLPPWISNPRAIGSDASTSFQALNMSEQLFQNLDRRGFVTATAVQTAVLPLLLPGIDNYQGDLCVSAPTGSGKTLAYVVPMVESLKARGLRRLRAVIVVPTRELVTQAREIAEACAVGTGVQVGTAVGSATLAAEQAQLVHKGQRWDIGGDEKSSELRAATDLREEAQQRVRLGYPYDDELLSSITHLLPYHVPEYSSNVDILICTPGRLVDHIRSTPGFTLQHVQWLVIDEADRLLDQGFQNWVDVVLPALELNPARNESSFLNKLKVRPPAKSVRKVILSATMTQDLSQLALLRLSRPTLVAVVEAQIDGEDAVDNMEQAGSLSAILPTQLSESAVPVGDGSEKPLYVLELLQSRLDMVDNSTEDNSVLIFCSNDDNATRLAHLLSNLVPALAKRTATLTKATSASERRKLLKSFRKGSQIHVLISTDRASRGLDVEDLTYVVNYDIAPSVTSYVHRVGRTARAGKRGAAWTLYTDKEAAWFWKAVASDKEIKRGGRTVDRVRFRDDAITDEMRAHYSRALEGLGEAVKGR